MYVCMYVSLSCSLSVHHFVPYVSISKDVIYCMKIFIYFFKITEYHKRQFQISKSLKPYGTGEPFLWIDT